MSIIITRQQIHYLDCSKKKNRIFLLKQTIEAINFEEKPSKQELEKICRKIGNKYKVKIQYVKCHKNNFIVSINVNDSGYSVISCLSYYEALCKYILYVRQYVKDSKLKVKK